MSEKIVLKGDDAIALWKSGKDSWNQWVEKHPEADVDFSGVDFGKHRENVGLISFDVYVFPKGDVSFRNTRFGKGHVGFNNTRFGDGDVDFTEAQFGDGPVYFRNTQFGDGDVDFTEAQFGDGHVDFDNTRFGKGHVDFTETQFGKGDVSFDNTRFGKGHVYFTETQFGDGDVGFTDTHFGEGNVDFTDTHFGDGHVYFRNTQFGDGDVDFTEAQFGKGNVYFYKAQFGDGDVYFYKAQFGDGHVDFSKAQFGDGHVYFRNTRFGDGDVDFTEAQFGKGNVSFSKAQFGDGHVDFRGSSWKGGCIFDPLEAKLSKSINFSSLTIDGELAFGDFSTSCVIDLRHSKLNRPIDLDRVDINYELEPSRWKRWPFHRAAKPVASTCFRRLKKLAKEADDHQRALDFYAKEMRSSYGHSLTGWKLALFFIYDKVSDYGRSILYPFLYLVLLMEVFGIVYWWRSTEASSTIYDGLTFSLGHAVPLYAGSREARSANAEALFGCIDNIPDYIHVLTITQGLICGAFLFLIALALRNLFRS